MKIPYAVYRRETNHPNAIYLQLKHYAARFSTEMLQSVHPMSRTLKSWTKQSRAITIVISTGDVKNHQLSFELTAVTIP